ncbi:MAG: type IX secretion system sortase PorU [Bacteroidetes bacterium]|nr:type IX secretion system sortase PorU [Bacteroidota bacterium]
MNSKKLIFLIIILTPVVLFSQKELKIISSNTNSLVVEFTPNYYDTTFINIGNLRFIKTLFKGGYIQNAQNYGEPAVPVKFINIGVPSEFGNTIEVLNSSYKEIKGELIPKPELIKVKGVDDNIFKKNEKYYNYKSSDDLVTFGDYGLARNLRTQSIIIHPVKYNAALKTIKLYTRIVFKINFSPVQVTSSKPASDLLDGAIINYNIAKRWTQSKLKKSIINSVLANGSWTRFEAKTEGIYKITKSQLTSLGIDPNTVDPRTIKIYNNSGKVLSENMNDPRPTDLNENAIYVSGENDGKFDDNDFIMFYGRGNNFWEYNKTLRNYKRYFHPYSNTNYYWITSGGNQGKRVISKVGFNITGSYVQTNSVGFASLEVDKKNIAQTGRIYLGDEFTTSSLEHTYTNKLDGRIDSYPLSYTFRFVNAASDNLILDVSENSTKIFSQVLPGYGTAPYIDGRAYIKNISFTGILPDNRSVLKFSLNSPSSVTTTGYLDYFEIRYQKELKAFNDNLFFYSKDTTSLIQYSLNSFSNSNIFVFDVTYYANVEMVTNPIQQSGGQFIFQANELKDNVHKYIAVGDDSYQFRVISNISQVSNSNLHGISEGTKFIIITHKNFLDAANRLKEYRETQSKITMSTIVVDIDEIFNEFSGGNVDVTSIRDFLKYTFDNWNITPEYVLFMGKGTYDPKNVEGFDNNYVPATETVESLSLIPSFTSDDYYVKVNGNDSFVDLASGRMTVRTLQEANNLIDKIIEYENSASTGIWRNLITLVADDGFTTTTFEGSEHTAPSEILSNTIIPPSFDQNKIYMAAFPFELTSAGRRMPAVNKAIIDAINNGTLILNYVGHGSPSLWAHEEVFVKSATIPQLHNDKYFFLSAATCDFGYYDIPDFQSAAEELLFLKNAGAIGVFTATRLVYSSLNHSLMYQFFSDLLKSEKDTMNLSIPIGKANFLTKQIFHGTNDQKYHIFGDPTLRLAIPRFVASIDSINNQYVATATDIQLKALSNTNISGEIKRVDGSNWNDFNGEGLLTVFDSERNVSLPAINNFPMSLQGGVIFRGRISINNGKFSTNFVVPKDISYENKNGKVLLYFTGQNIDGIGFTNKVRIGGTDTTAVNDGEGPSIDIFFDNLSSRNNTLITPNSKLIVKLSDNTGLNTTGTGIGHKLEGILNDNVNSPIDFTNFFTSDLNSGGKTGQINYTFNNLSPGDYKIKIKAWDVFNNFSSQESFFSVVSQDELLIRNVYNYPNPFSSNTTFTFQQNLNTFLDVKIKIYTVAGRLIRRIERNSISDKFVTVAWDGRDQDGDLIANGIYLYKIIVKTVDGVFSKSVLGKLAVIR